MEPLYAVVIFSAFFNLGSVVEVKEKLPHSPFGDLDEELITLSSKHKIFAMEDLSRYDGQNPELPIYAAVKGVVFDVSSAKDLYGPGKPYHPLTGKDASRAIAKWSLIPSELNGNLDNLNEDELKRLEDTFDKVYMAKYPVVGYLEGHEPKLDDINVTWRREDL